MRGQRLRVVLRRETEIDRLDQCQGPHAVGMRHRQPQRHRGAKGMADHVHPVGEEGFRDLGDPVLRIAAPVPVGAAPVAEHVEPGECGRVLELRRQPAPGAGMAQRAMQRQHLPGAVPELPRENRLRNPLPVHHICPASVASRSSSRS